MPWNSRLSLLIMWTLFLLPSASCQESGTVTVTEKEGHCTATDNDNAQVVSARVGDTLIVNLPVTPATGAVWHVAHSEAVKEKEKTKYELLEEGKPGAKGQQVFQLVVEKRGQYTLLFSLDRGDERRSVCTFKLDARK